MTSYVINPDTRHLTPALPLWNTDTITTLGWLPNWDVRSTSYLGNTPVRKLQNQDDWKTQWPDHDSSCVTCAANCGPQSEIIIKGKPVCFHMLSRSNWLVSTAVMLLLQGERIIALLCRSMTVRILSYPFEVGRSVMKSIVMVSHIPCSISLGLSGTLTGGLIFVVWQTAHPLMSQTASFLT